MKDILSYKDFIGSVHYSDEDEIFYGKLEEIDDLVTFEGKSVSELKKSFKDTVEDYISLCSKHGKPLFKSFRGTFNVRINPDLHRKAVRKSLVLGISLNQFVQSAIEKEIVDSKSSKKK
ncbi:HicB family protein [Leptospira inadai serovar Lyme str. 10]|uniref:HicB family protein n=2 Tax=Leptospira inadai serovar Lyme TaxID=293084 RepID=V6H852_9LEPT|nr:type II toxin-antitoxin system HicB family antitoxin [Leptospira inadai]EQA34832.1 HicB family protein [Leptospira inadai serovar Lyme str. 10]PNV76195.1 type II toxin-antitoxin system HicB family antitoxin [Leptospira inadai serovar Lyme]